MIVLTCVLRENTLHSDDEASRADHEGCNTECEQARYSQLFSFGH
jgi:hypothetical protein